MGYDHTVAGARVIAILAPKSSPMKRLRERAADEGRRLDATNGRRTRSIIIMDSNHAALSAIAPETLWRRGRWVSEAEA